MIRALIAGQEDPDELAELARRRWRQELPALRTALRGQVTEHHRFMLRMHNFLKANQEFQKKGPKQFWHFAPGSAGDPAQGSHASGA